MNHWITVFNNLFKFNPKINDLDIVLESDGKLSTSPPSHYTSINNKLETTFLNPVSNPSSNPTKLTTTSSTSNYNPPSKTPPTSNKTPPTSSKTQEESPFSKFRIWGQKS